MKLAFSIVTYCELIMPCRNRKTAITKPAALFLAEISVADGHHLGF